MKYNTPMLKNKNIVLKKGNLNDYKQVYEYDFKYLNNVWNPETIFIKNNDDRIIKLFNLIENQENTYSWIIFVDYIPVGHIVADREKNKTIELAYNLHPHYWGKGIMQTAILLVIDYLLTKYDEIFVGYCTGNEKSRKLIEKLNFKPYKIIKNAQEKDGKYVDEYVYSIKK